MRVKFYSDLIECSKYKIPQPIANITKEEFIDIYKEKGILKEFLCLAAKSRGTLMCNINSDYSFMYDIDTVHVNRFIKGLRFEDYPKEDNFYFMVEFWGKAVFFLILTNVN